MTQHIGILTAGGDSPGLNAAIRGVGKAALGYYGMQVIGFRDGFRGLMENRTLRLEVRKKKVLLGLASAFGAYYVAERLTRRRSPGRWAAVGVLSFMLLFLPTNLGFNEIGLSFLLTQVMVAPIAVVVALASRVLTTIYDIVIALVAFGVDSLQKKGDV